MHVQPCHVETVRQAIENGKMLEEAMTLRSRFKGDKPNEESRRIRDEILNDALARNRDADVGELLWGQLKP